MVKVSVGPVGAELLRDAHDLGPDQGLVGMNLANFWMLITNFMHGFLTCLDSGLGFLRYVFKIYILSCSIHLKLQVPACAVWFGIGKPDPSGEDCHASATITNLNQIRMCHVCDYSLHTLVQLHQFRHLQQIQSFQGSPQATVSAVQLQGRDWVNPFETQTHDAHRNK